jgi:hypothetical protein
MSGAGQVRAKNVLGQQFGRLRVVSRAQNQHHKALWNCRCDCGKETVVSGHALRSGRSQSCGCRTADVSRTHGKSRTRAYRIWNYMLQRCENPNNSMYRLYGARGVTVCHQWHAFANFFEDMGDPPIGTQLDRKDNSAGYSKANCRWVTPKVNARNRSTNVRITHLGETRTAVEWAEATGLPQDLITQRIRRGWPPERALNEAPQARAARPLL